jgi:hypothetical protein
MPQGTPATVADGVARYGNDETRPPTRLSGGLFNQLWALQGLVMDAYESKLPLILPSWDSHLFPASMGLEKDARFKRPLQLPFAALWRKDVFTNTLREHGVVAVASNDSWQAANAVASTSTAAMRRYMRYMIRRANGTENAHPLEDVVYRALSPAPHLARRVERLLRRLRLISSGSTFGCLHARVERDMQRWWYHVAKARPPTMRQILDAIGSEARMQRSRAIYVCVGSDLKPRDREVLGNRTSWGAALLRRPTLLAEDAEDEAAARAGSSEHSKEDDGRYVRVGSSQRRASCTQVLTTALILSSPQVLLHPWERCGACKCSPRRVSSLPHRYSIPGSGVVRRKMGAHDTALWSEWLREVLREGDGGHHQTDDEDRQRDPTTVPTIDSTNISRSRNISSSSSRSSEELGPIDDPPRHVPLTYIEKAILDFSVCRHAAWFAGWSSSSFSASMAYLRHLDHNQGSYAYCAKGSPFSRTPPQQQQRKQQLQHPQTVASTGHSSPAVVLQHEHSRFVRLHTCRTTGLG